MCLQVLSTLGAPCNVVVSQGVNTKSYVVTWLGQEFYGTEQFVRGVIAAAKHLQEANSVH